MKKRAALIVSALLCLSLLSASCAEKKNSGATAARNGEQPADFAGETLAPGGEENKAGIIPFTLEDWKTCGFEPDAGKEELSVYPGTRVWTTNEGADMTMQKAATDFGCVYLISGRPSETAKAEESDVWKSVKVTVENENIKAPALPRGLKIGGSADDVARAFGLKSAAYGVCYGDGKSPPYATARDFYGLPYTVFTFAAAGEREETLCTLEITADAAGGVISYSYCAESNYRPQFGLPDISKVKEARVYYIKGDDLVLSDILTAQEAADMLRYLKDARQYSMFMPEYASYKINLIYNTGDYLLTVGTNGIADAQGRLYNVRLPKSITDTFMPAMADKNADIPAARETTGEGYGSWTGYSGLIDNEKNLLPGLPKVKDITEIRTYRIEEGGSIRIFSPAWGAIDLLAHIQKGYDKQLKEELREPLFNIKVKTKKSSCLIVVGSNGIKAPDGKVYDITFKDDMILRYFPGKTQVDTELMLPKSYNIIYIRDNRTGEVLDARYRDYETITDILKRMQICVESVSGSSDYNISGMNKTYSHRYRYYVKSRRIVFGDDVYKLAEEDAKMLDRIIEELF